MRVFTSIRALPLIALLGLAAPLAAADKAVAVLPTTDLDGLKTLLADEIVAGGWQLHNEGDRLLLFTNPDISHRDRMLLSASPYDRERAPFYRYRVSFVVNPASIAVSMSKELAYTDDQGTPRIREKDDEKTLDEMHRILDRVRRKLTAPRP